MSKNFSQKIRYQVAKALRVEAETIQKLPSSGESARVETPSSFRHFLPSSGEKFSPSSGGSDLKIAAFTSLLCSKVLSYVVSLCSVIG